MKDLLFCMPAPMLSGGDARLGKCKHQDQIAFGHIQYVPPGKMMNNPV